MKFQKQFFGKGIFIVEMRMRCSQNFPQYNWSTELDDDKSAFEAVYVVILSLIQLLLCSFQTFCVQLFLHLFF